MLYRPTNAAIGKIALLAGSPAGYFVACVFLAKFGIRSGLRHHRIRPRIDTGPVATFTGTDPEGRTVYWSLLESHQDNGAIEVDGVALIPDDVADYEDFSISADGVLSFNIPPDHENPDRRRHGGQHLQGGGGGLRQRARRGDD